ncbi:MAG: sulfatase-like hydrolase/transferase [Pelobium sp.]
MPIINPVKNRYSTFFGFIIYFVFFSFLLRLGLSIFSIAKSELGFISFVIIFFKGLIFDVGVAIFFSLLYSMYLLLLPQRWVKTKFNTIVTYTLLSLMILIAMFSFFAEVTFWAEFESRFNFIAVDYLIYTYEVVNNINESYPLPILIGGMILITIAVLFILVKTNSFSNSFNSKTFFLKRLLITGSTLLIAIFYIFFVSNSWAENKENRYEGELSKAGVYSFFSAFKNNELNYSQFYDQISDEKAFSIIRNELKESNSKFLTEGFSIKRNISADTPTMQPNVMMVTIESLSAEFMTHFGNEEHLMPNLDQLADEGLLFTNMYATGTRTVRGMEALTLSVPPTPGNSIVRRKDNANLSTIGEIFRQHGYQTTFLYGGDGYFDNMNQYFGSNGFNIVDRGRNITVGDNYETTRTIIKDEEVSFENAWGICDEDLFDQAIKNADQHYKKKEPFYDFIMTTSNHRPFTYPAGKIDIPSGSGREGAVKYTDYAIGEFVRKAKLKPWFKNTVIIFVADHCASSAGKNEINIDKYHIPCVVYNLGNQAQKLDKMCSQIDLYPTLFNLMGWNYNSNLFGKDVLKPDYSPRAILGTYQKLAYLKEDSLVILSPQQMVDTYLYVKKTNDQNPAKFPEKLIDKAKAEYQSAYYLYKNGGLKK